MLTKEEIRLACMDEGVYRRGRQLYRSGGVISIYLEEYGEDVLALSAEVRGNGQPFYECEVILSEDIIDEYSCDCPAGMDSRRGMCSRWPTRIRQKIRILRNRKDSQKKPGYRALPLL